MGLRVSLHLLLLIHHSFHAFCFSIWSITPHAIILYTAGVHCHVSTHPPRSLFQFLLTFPSFSPKKTVQCFLYVNILCPKIYFCQSENVFTLRCCRIFLLENSRLADFVSNSLQTAFYCRPVLLFLLGSQMSVLLLF